MEDDMKLDFARPNVLTSKKPIFPNGNGNANGNDNSEPATIAFGDLPNNTVPCDGIMTRDNGDIVDICMNIQMLDQTPENYQVCLYSSAAHWIKTDQ
jgi:hypothetical protein